VSTISGEDHFAAQLLIGAALIWLGGLRHYSAIVFLTASIYCAMTDWFNPATRLSMESQAPECNQTGEQSDSPEPCSAAASKTNLNHAKRICGNDRTS
jgi:hypothetical protein